MSYYALGTVGGNVLLPLFISVVALTPPPKKGKKKKEMKHESLIHAESQKEIKVPLLLLGDGPELLSIGESMLIFKTWGNC